MQLEVWRDCKIRRINKIPWRNVCWIICSRSQQICPRSCFGNVGCVGSYVLRDFLKNRIISKCTQVRNHTSWNVFEMYLLIFVRAYSACSSKDDDSTSHNRWASSSTEIRIERLGSDGTCWGWEDALWYLARKESRGDLIQLVQSLIVQTRGHGESCDSFDFRSIAGQGQDRSDRLSNLKKSISGAFEKVESQIRNNGNSLRRLFLA